MLTIPRKDTGMVKITGIKHSTGEFEGRKYDNYYFYGEIVSDRPSSDQKIGSCPDRTYKVKSSVVEKCYSGKVTALLNKNIQFYKDDFNNIASFSVEE